jgi:hypothetical protein
MSGPMPEIEASDAMLAEAAKSDLVLMRHVQSLALASDDAAEVGTLVHAYARVSRAMRQNLALLARQKADRAKAAREAQQPAVADEARKTPQEVAYEARADHLVEAVERVIAHVAAGDRERHTELTHRFDRELDDWYEKPDFLDLDPQAHIRHACRRLGLPEHLADTWPDLPAPPNVPDPEARTPCEARPETPKPDSPLAINSAEDPPVPLSDTG